MFEPHSLLWSYLWIAPSVLLLLLAVLFYRRSLQQMLQVFLVFAMVQGVMSLALYAGDHMSSVSATLWWKANWFRLLIEVILKFAVIGEIFYGIFQPYPSISKLGRTMIRGVGAALVLVATLGAALAPTNTAVVGIIAGGHLLELADFMIECGLLVFIYLFAAYFRLAWERLSFGIGLGLGISAAEQLGTWALLANLALTPHRRNVLDIVNMATYHACVVLWLYYTVTTPKWTPKTPPRHDEDIYLDHDASGEDRQKNLDVWNRELERLLHQ